MAVFELIEGWYNPHRRQPPRTLLVPFESGCLPLFRPGVYGYSCAGPNDHLPSPAWRTLIGESLGPYKILELLGAGGMGEVYLGEDTRLGRKVAIKVLPQEFASDAERLARFEQEARAAAALNHPHIAVVHDIGTEASLRREHGRVLVRDR